MKIWIEETLLLLSFLALLILLAYSPIWGSEQPESKTEYKYILCELKGFEFVPISKPMDYKDCKKKERRSESKVCIADINDRIVIEEINP